MLKKIPPYLALVFVLLTSSITVFAQGTAFTYQGQLLTNGAPANGVFDIRAGLYITNTGGTVFAGPITNLAVTVSNGLFIIPLDYGNVFNGTVYWLQIAVRTNGGSTFTVLSPRQELTPNPYAIFAEGANAAGLSGTIPSSDISGTYTNPVTLSSGGNSFTGNGGGLTNINATSLGGVSAGNFWQLGGNSVLSGQFIGTLDAQPFDLYAGGTRAMRLVMRTDSEGVYSNAPNIIAGSPINTASASFVGQTISGGGGNDGTFSLANSVLSDFGTIGGGAANTVSGDFGAIGGGDANNVAGVDATIGGGYGNIASYNETTVGGGAFNFAENYFATVPGGYSNTAAGFASFAAGEYAYTTNYNTFIWGDGSEQPFTGAGFDNGFNVLANGGVFFFNGAEGLHIDYLNQNSGTISYGLRFGAGASGEGMASQRMAGVNQYGLDFYTSGNNRMSIANNGFVGINTNSPSQRLEVNGNYVQIDGGNAADGNGSIDAYIGGSGSGSDVQIGSMNSLITAVGFWNNAAGAWMHIACSSITINGGSDLAEPFPISNPEKEIPEGAVVVIDEKNPGRLKLSDQAYDTRVAGVVSGANGINPGIQMRQEGLLAGGKNVALTGRVYALADASNGAIQPGDLLTTSSTPGHAMKVTRHSKAQGAILGKAMTGLSEGKGMVLVLVTLQ